MMFGVFFDFLKTLSMIVLSEQGMLVPYQIYYCIFYLRQISKSIKFSGCDGIIHKHQGQIHLILEHLQDRGKLFHYNLFPK